MERADDARRMTGKLDGTVALVTGASRGIGQAIAVAMAEAGADVVCNATEADHASETVRRVLATGRRAVAVGARVEDPDAVERMLDRAQRELGIVDILVNNAGIANVTPLLEMDPAQWDRVMGINVKGTMLCSQAAVHRLRAAKRKGALVNLGSVTGINAAPMRGVYGAAKAAVHQLTKVMAIEWADLGVRVNCIAPGFVRTDAVDGVIRAGKLDAEKIERRVPQGRIGSVSEIADAAVFLASDEATYITGAVLTVDGGYTAYGFL